MSLSAAELPVGWLRCLHWAPLYRDKALRSKAQWCYLWGGACPGASKSRAQAALGRDSPGRCLFLCHLFLQWLSKLSAFCVQNFDRGRFLCFPLSVDFLLKFVWGFFFLFFYLFFHKITSQAALPGRIAELLAGFLFFLSLTV